MKLMIYTTAFAPQIGGVETYVRLLAEGLSAYQDKSDQMQVAVVTTTQAAGFDDATLPFQVERRPSVWRLVKLLRESDIVQLAGPCLLPQLLGWLLRKRVIVEHHGYQAACPNGLFLREPMKEICPGHFERAEYGKCFGCASAEYGSVRGLWMVVSTFPRHWLSKRAKQNVCVSEHVKGRLHLPRSRVIYHGIPSAGNGASTTQPDRASFVFGYVGRFVAEKNLTTLIEAAKTLADDGFEFRLQFVGDGVERARLEAEATASGLAGRTRFTGYLTGDPLSAAIAEMSVVVIPTISEETFGLSALEYMAQGKPVLVADVGGLSEVVGDAGVKFRPGDAVDLAREMKRFLENPALLLEYGKKGKCRASFFSLDRMVERHSDLYREMAAT